MIVKLLTLLVHQLLSSFRGFQLVLSSIQCNKLDQQQQLNRFIHLDQELDGMDNKIRRELLQTNKVGAEFYKMQRT